MIATGLLHAFTWPWHLIFWFGGILFLGGALVGTILIVRSKRPSKHPLQESLFVFGPAAATGPLLILCARLFQAVEPSFGEGPQVWLALVLPGDGRFLHPYDTLVVLYLITSAMTAVVAVGLAFLTPPPGDKHAIPPLRGRSAVAAMIGLTLIAIPFFGFRVYTHDLLNARLMDVLGVLPVVLMALGLRAYATTRGPLIQKEAPTAQPAPAAAIDPRTTWVQAGLMTSDATPLAQVESTEHPADASHRSRAAWTAVQAPGSPPN